VTRKLSHDNPILRHAMSIRVMEESFEMNEMSCPWCEADIVLRVVADEQSCPECGTTWTYEDEPAVMLPLAA
jgi:predicted RNA-binding Zn-ribbon protein involved in translation (DUF1610 family)